MVLGVLTGFGYLQSVGLAGLGTVHAQAGQGSAAGWKPARTADGQPDLQGVWTNATITPLERPAQFSGRATLTAEEAAALEKQVAQQAGAADTRRPSGGGVGTYNQFWMDSGTKVVSTRQTSLVTDPADGRV